MVVLRTFWRSAKCGEGWGHSSLQVGGPPPAGIYISWWPSNLDGRPFKSDSWFAESMKVDDDIRLEGQPNEIIYINELDERSIKVWWMNWRRSSMVYAVTGKNCSSAVAKALEAGGSERFAKTPAVVVWTPARLASYARAIVAGQSARK